RAVLRAGPRDGQVVPGIRHDLCDDLRRPGALQLHVDLHDLRPGLRVLRLRLCERYRSGAAGDHAGLLSHPAPPDREERLMAATLTETSLDARPSYGPAGPGGKGARRRSDVRMHVLLSIASVVTIFPFYAMIVISLQPGEAIKFPDALYPSDISFSYYEQAVGSQNIPQWTANS